MAWRRLHPIAVVTALIESVRSAIALILPVLAIAVPNRDSAVVMAVIVAVIGLIAAWMLVSPVVRWLTTGYRMDDHGITQRSGVFNRTRTTIAYDHIHTLSSSAPIYMRPFHVVILDITEREERENLRREFTANVSHELKTPLTSISGFAEIIQNGIVKPQDIPRFAGNIYVESQRLISLVDDILNLSRLDEEDVQLEREDFDLAALARDVADRLKDSAKKNGVVISVQGNKTMVNGVKSIVDEMVYNLVDNGVKYNKKNGRVTVTAETLPEGPTITVTDTGIGIPQGDVDRVFERFYRVDKSHSKDISGTGLGLSIVKHGAALHDGQIRLESTPGKGTTVTLLLPQG